MKEAKYTILINKPVGVVFEFSTNPNNTPKWIDGIVEEKTSEWPIKLGTIYENKGKQGTWNKYKVSELEPNKLFALSREGGDYNVRYTFTPKGENACELEYFEWVNEGELDDTFSQETLEDLKTIIENTEA